MRRGFKVKECQRDTSSDDNKSPKKEKTKKWITPDKWTKIGERKDLKVKMLNAKSPRLQEQITTAVWFRGLEDLGKRHEELGCLPQPMSEKIRGIFSPEVIWNKELYKKTSSSSVVD